MTEQIDAREEELAELELEEDDPMDFEVDMLESFVMQRTTGKCSFKLHVLRAADQKLLQARIRRLG